MSRSKYQDELEDIWEMYHYSGSICQLIDFLYTHLDVLDWEDWSYVFINFQLGKRRTRQFKDYLDLSFINEFALQDYIEKDIDFMRQFRKEFKWVEK